MMEIEFLNNEYFNAEIVEVKRPVTGLTDGNIYVVEKPETKLLEDIAKAIEAFKENVSFEDLIYSYDVSGLGDAFCGLESNPILNAAQNGANVILPICTPSKEAKEYMVARIATKALDVYIPSMIMYVENLTRKSVEEALMNLAVFEADSCDKLINETFDDGPSKNLDDEYSLLPGLLEYFSDAGVFAMAMAPRKTLPRNISHTLSYQESREIFQRFVKNCNLIKRNQDRSKLSETQEKRLKMACREVEYVFKSFPAEVVGKFTIEVMKKNISFAYENCLNRDGIAAKSKIHVSIERPKKEIDAEIDPKVINKLKTNGKYRVYLSNGEQTVQVMFGRSASCVIYIMYLLDRKKRGDEIDTIRISKNETLFCELYGYIYNELDARDRFNMLKSGHSNLTNCYLDIRDSLNDAVSQFGESAVPFYIPNEYSHITVLRERITIPPIFENLGFVY